MYSYRSQTKLREGNVFTPVCHSVHKGECFPACNGQGGLLLGPRRGCLPLGPGGCLPLGLGRVYPLLGRPPRLPLKWAVRILLEQGYFLLIFESWWPIQASEQQL